MSKQYDGHPLFDPSITWMSPQEMENRRNERIMAGQSQRESGYQKRRKAMPDYMTGELGAEYASNIVSGEFPTSV